MWLTIAIICLVAVIVFFLCVPIDTTCRVDIYGKPRFNLRLVWLFGLVSKELKRGQKRTKAEKPGKMIAGTRRIRQILRFKGLARQLKIFITDVINHLRIKDFSIDFKIGFSDPADTGFLFAIIGSALTFISPSHNISLRPSFEGEAILEGYAQGVVRVIPVKLIVPCLRFCFSLATLKTFWMVVLVKWKKRK